jgi:hypothetical protein
MININNDTAALICSAQRRYIISQDEKRTSYAGRNEVKRD